jgi:hypothetical protein
MKKPAFRFDFGHRQFASWMTPVEDRIGEREKTLIYTGRFSRLSSRDGNADEIASGGHS